MADRRGALIPLLIITFIFLSPSPQARFREQEARPRIEDVAAEEQRSLGVLQNSSYETPLQSLNLTGLEEERGYAWNALPEIKARAWDQLQYALGDWGTEELQAGNVVDRPTALYNNVTGFVHGKWVRSKIQDSVPVPQLNLTEYAPESPFGGPPRARPFGRNMTGDGGDVTIRFNERNPFGPAGWGDESGNITEMNIELKLSDEATNNEWELLLRGIYLPNLGQAILTTTSDKLAGIFLLPHLALSPRTHDMVRIILNQSISEIIQDQLSHRITSFNPWTAATTSDTITESPFSYPDCDMVVYLQQLPPTQTTAPYTNRVLAFLERELRFPSGAILPPTPEMRFSMLAFSPDCGYVLESRGPPDDSAQTSNHLIGPKIESLYHRGRHHLLIYTAALTLQLVLLMRQMREASTPSTRSRLSFYTIAGLALGDGFVTMAFCLVSLFVDGLWINLIGTAFLSFVSVSFFGMRFLMDIWTAHEPERRERARIEREAEMERERRLREALIRIRREREERIAALRTAEGAGTEAQGDVSATAEGNQAVADDDARTTGEPPAPTLPPPPAHQPPVPASLPPPVTAQRNFAIDTGATPVFMPSDQEGLLPITQPRDPLGPPVEPPLQLPSFGSLYARFYLLLLATLFLSLNAASWPSSARRVYFTALAMVYLGFWIPQIKRNAQRNCRKALRWDFVLGQSGLRLLPFVYFYAYEGNVLFAGKDLVSLGIMGVWVWVQVVVLASQEIVGPRWFVRNDWVPPAYDYHPILREDEEGGTLPLGLSDSQASVPSSPALERRTSIGSPVTARRGSLAKETEEKGKRIFDCAICMQDLEVPVIEPGGPNESAIPGSMMLARRQYMVTPCRHIFHSGCLEGWLKYRLQCPICRESLPPL